MCFNESAEQPLKQKGMFPVESMIYSLALKFAAFRIAPPKALLFGEVSAERREGLQRYPLCRLAATSPPKGETSGGS